MLVAAADSVGTIANRDGLDVGALIELKAASKSVVDYSRGDVGDKNAVVDVECDIWIPAARPDVLRSDNADHLRAKIVLPGANIPTTPSAERALHERGVLCVPDFIANAGGVIADAIEYAGGTETAAFAAIRDRIRRNTETVLAKANERGIMPSQAAVELATERVKKAMSYRRWSVF
jgi:glutamate dehydrogenase (NAD(P)+)